MMIILFSHLLASRHYCITFIAAISWPRHYLLFTTIYLLSHYAIFITLMARLRFLLTLLFTILMPLLLMTDDITIARYTHYWYWWASHLYYIIALRHYWAYYYFHLLLIFSHYLHYYYGISRIYWLQDTHCCIPLLPDSLSFRFHSFH